MTQRERDELIAEARHEIAKRDAEIERLRAALKDSYENNLYDALHAGVTNGGLWWPGGMSDAEWFCRTAGITYEPQFTKDDLAKRVPAIAAELVAKVSAVEQSACKEG